MDDLIVVWVIIAISIAFFTIPLIVDYVVNKIRDKRMKSILENQDIINDKSGSKKDDFLSRYHFLIENTPSYDTNYGKTLFDEENINELSNETKRKIALFGSKNAKDSYREDSEVEISLSKVDYSERTRAAKVTFTKYKTYKTIAGYRQINYVRYPIYSAPKTKSSTFLETIVLSNEVLEAMDNPYAYELRGKEGIANLAEYIIAKIGREELYPSWLLRKWLDKAMDAENKNLSLRNAYADNSLQVLSNQISSFTKNIETKKGNTVKKRQKVNRKLEKYQKKIQKSGNPIRSLFRNRNMKRKQYAENKLDLLNKEIENMDDMLHSLEQKLQEEEKRRDEVKNSISQRADYAQSVYKSLKSKVKKLEKIKIDNPEFVSLKQIPFIQYEKIIGCYVIRNTENGKCYVGQSKDVIKRIKQHFHGTVPNNTIFSEDYYMSKLKDKSDLFEVKVYPCIDKSELDDTERTLIEKYNSYENGYNRTSGNT